KKAKSGKSKQEKITVEDIQAFVEFMLDENTTTTIVSEPRPKNDVDPRYPHILRVVNSSFNELVLETNSDVLLLSYRIEGESEWWKKLLNSFAKIMGNTLRVAVINSVRNDAPVSNGFTEV